MTTTPENARYLSCDEDEYYSWLEIFVDFIVTAVAGGANSTVVK